MKVSRKLFVFLMGPAMALAQGVPVATPPSGPAPTATPDMAHAPKIISSKTKFDFGNVDEGPDIVHKFHVANRGKGTLKIKSVSTSCGCTAAIPGSKYPVPKADKDQGVMAVIPPGGWDVIQATYHTNGRPGHATKFITVTSNDPVNPSFQLQLDMTVQRDIDLQPDRLYLYSLKHGQPHSSTIKILGKAGEDLEILSATATGNVVTVTSVAPYKDEANNRNGATIQVDVPVTQAIGSFTDNISIKTNNKKKPEVTVPVLGEIVGPVQFNPKSLNFAPHQEMAVTIMFTPDEPKKFAIRSVASENHLVRPSIVKTNVNGVDQYALSVSVIKNVPQTSDGKDKVDVYTNDPEMGKISIDVQANK